MKVGLSPFQKEALVEASSSFLCPGLSSLQSHDCGPLPGWGPLTESQLSHPERSGPPSSASTLQTSSLPNWFCGEIHSLLRFECKNPAKWGSQTDETYQHSKKPHILLPGLLFHLQTKQKQLSAANIWKVGVTDQLSHAEYGEACSNNRLRRRSVQHINAPNEAVVKNQWFSWAKISWKNCISPTASSHMIMDTDD